MSAPGTMRSRRALAHLTVALALVALGGGDALAADAEGPDLRVTAMAEATAAATHAGGTDGRDSARAAPADDPAGRSGQPPRGSAAQPEAAPAAADVPASPEGPGRTAPPVSPAIEDAALPPTDAPADDAVSNVPDPVWPPDWGPISMLGEKVFPGDKRELVFLSSESFQAMSIQSPVVVIRGTQPGPTLCLTAGVHGDELNGVEIVRRILDETKAADLHGTIVGVPIVNIQGFERSSRYLPDRRDLNRYFPGRPDGSSASRIAYAFFESVVRQCDALVDLHTGSFHRANIAQVRGDLRNEQVLDLAKAFGTEVVVHNVGRMGTLRRAATEAEIPAIIYEAGEPMRFQRTQIERGAAGIRNLLERLGLTEQMRLPTEKQWIYYRSKWIRVDHGGILLSEVRLGDWVRENEVLATVTDPMGRGRSQVISPHRGRVLGMTLAPVVMPGVATFFIGLDTTGPPDEKPEELDPDEVEVEDERPE